MDFDEKDKKNTLDKFEDFEELKNSIEFEDLVYFNDSSEEYDDLNGEYDDYNDDYDIYKSDNSEYNKSSILSNNELLETHKKLQEFIKLFGNLKYISNDFSNQMEENSKNKPSTLSKNINSQLTNQLKEKASLKKQFEELNTEYIKFCEKLNTKYIINSDNPTSENLTKIFEVTTVQLDINIID